MRGQGSGVSAQLFFKIAQRTDFFGFLAWGLEGVWVGYLRGQLAECVVFLYVDFRFLGSAGLGYFFDNRDSVLVIGHLFFLVFYLFLQHWDLCLLSRRRVQLSMHQTMLCLILADLIFFQSRFGFVTDLTSRDAHLMLDLGDSLGSLP